VIFPQHNQKSGTCFKELLRALRGKIWALRHSPLAIMVALRKKKSVSGGLVANVPERMRFYDISS
jgi:hypothetical protein